MTEREKELIVLDKHPISGESAFDTFTGNLTNCLWIQVDGVRYYNLGCLETSGPLSIYGWQGEEPVLKEFYA